MSDDNDSKIDTGSNVGNFIVITLITIVIIILYFVISGLTLYGCKAAVSGILPTNSAFYPYTNAETVVKGQLLSNIFTTYTDPPLSEKISFYPKGDDAKQTFGLINYLRKLNTDKDASALTKYFIDIIMCLMSLDYWLLDKTLGFLNGAPELLIVLFGPIVLHILSMVMIPLNYIYLMFLWFYKMTWFFKKSTNGSHAKEDSNTSKHVKEGIFWGFIDIMTSAFFGSSTTSESKHSSSGEYVDTFFGFCYALLLVWIFSILFIILLLLGWGFLPVVVAHNCMITTFCLKTEISDKKSSGFTVVYNLFRFYKTIIMGFISFAFVSSTFSFLGNTFGLAALIVLTLIIFVDTGITMFKPEKIDGLTIALESKPTTSGGGKINRIIQSGGDSKEFFKQINKLTKKMKTNN